MMKTQEMVAPHHENNDNLNSVIACVCVCLCVWSFSVSQGTSQQLCCKLSTSSLPRAAAPVTRKRRYNQEDIGSGFVKGSSVGVFLEPLHPGIPLGTALGVYLSLHSTRLHSTLTDACNAQSAAGDSGLFWLQ